MERKSKLVTELYIVSSYKNDKGGRYSNCKNRNQKQFVNPCTYPVLITDNVVAYLNTLIHYGYGSEFRSENT